MSDDVKSEGGYTVVPSQIRALSKEAKAWFTATALNAGAYAKKNRVPQDLAEGKRACTDAKRADEFVPSTRPNRYDSHVDAFRAIEAETYWSAVWERVRESYPTHYDRASYLHEHRPSTAHRHASWFAFDDQGKVVLSLRVTRERALDIALGYNDAGGRLVLLAPEPILDDADVNDCVAIPDQRPPAEPVREDPLIAFAGEDGLFYMTPHGRMAIPRLDGKKPDASHLLIDPAVTGEATRATSAPHADDPDHDMAARFIEGVLVTKPSVTWAKLPNPMRIDTKAGKVPTLVLTHTGGETLVSPALVKAVGKGAVSFELVEQAESTVLLVRRRDGLIGLVAPLANRPAS